MKCHTEQNKYILDDIVTKTKLKDEDNEISIENRPTDSNRFLFISEKQVQL